MLGILNLEEIQGLLLRVPALIDQLERRDANFVRDVKHWLLALEQVLVGNRMAIAGSVAALRGMLNSAELGVIPQGVAFHGRPTARKIRDSTASDVLRRVSDLVSEAVRVDSLRIAEANMLAHQLVVLAKSNGAVPADPPDMNRARRLQEIWKALSANPNTAPGAVRLASMLRQSDVAIVLDRSIAAR